MTSKTEGPSSASAARSLRVLELRGPEEPCHDAASVQAGDQDINIVAYTIAYICFPSQRTIFHSN